MPNKLDYITNQPKENSIIILHAAAITAISEKIMFLLHCTLEKVVPPKTVSNNGVMIFEERHCSQIIQEKKMLIKTPQVKFHLVPVCRKEDGSYPQNIPTKYYLILGG